LPVGTDVCPKCTTQASNEMKSSDSKSISPTEGLPASSRSDSHEEVTTASSLSGEKRASTLIEFPGAGKSRPKSQWRQELSERVRAIQERKAREASENGEMVPAGAQTAGASQLGLVAPREAADVNPIVAAALKRIERARESSPLPRGGRHTAGATAVARVRHEDFDFDFESQANASPAIESPVIPPEAAEPIVEEPVKERKLVVVPPPPAPVAEPIVAKAPRKVIAGVVDEDYLSRLEEQLLPPVATVDPFDNYGTIPSRMVAGIIDLLIVLFFTSPFAAVIELTGGNWTDPRVLATIGGIAALVLFLYHTAAISLSGKTFGMSALGLRVVNASTGNHPSTFQTMFRSICYVVVIVTGFLGLIPSLFGGQRRAIHDMLSRTVVVSN
jgi:uncharacterized RDD family membrane protein YckC